MCCSGKIALVICNRRGLLSPEQKCGEFAGTRYSASGQINVMDSMARQSIALQIAFCRQISCFLAEQDFKFARTRPSTIFCPLFNLRLRCSSNESRKFAGEWGDSIVCWTCMLIECDPRDEGGKFAATWRNLNIVNRCDMLVNMMSWYWCRRYLFTWQQKACKFARQRSCSTSSRWCLDFKARSRLVTASSLSAQISPRPLNAKRPNSSDQ